METGAAFLAEATGSADASSAWLIAAELGGLPLALAQSVAYCKATGRSLADYLRLLRENHSEVLARNAPAAHTAPVVATWSLAMAELEADTPGSMTVLRIAAYLAPDDIPFRMLLHPVAGLPRAGMDRSIAEQVEAICASELAVDDAVAALRQHSLIGAPGETFSIHRLVQAVTRSQMPLDEQAGWRRTAAVLVDAAVPRDTDARGSWAACRLLLPHAQAVADPLGSAMWRLAVSLGASGDYAAARAQWHVLAEAHTARLGPDHPDTLAARSGLARWTGEAGDAAAARDLFAALLPIREQVSGPDHPATLVARSSLARWTGEVGDAVAARDLYAALVPIFQKVSGPEHPETLVAWSNLARWTGEAGDAVAARDLNAALLPIWEQVSGPDHPATLIARSSFARWTGQAGDATAARDLYAALLPVQEKVLGPEHPDTLTTRANHAFCTGEAGDAVAARDLYAALLPIRNKVLGAEPPATLTARSNLAYWSRRAGSR